MTTSSPLLGLGAFLASLLCAYAITTISPFSTTPNLSVDDMALWGSVHQVQTGLTCYGLGDWLRRRGVKGTLGLAS
jgi:hypothetical protein